MLLRLIIVMILSAILGGLAGHIIPFPFGIIVAMAIGVAIGWYGFKSPDQHQ
jgi:uncharacterized membrane protein YbjE (DUF340 family)